MTLANMVRYWSKQPVPDQSTPLGTKGQSMRSLIEKYLNNCQAAADEAKKAMIANLGAVDVCKQMLADMDKEGKTDTENGVNIDK